MHPTVPPPIDPEDIIPAVWVELALVASGLTQAELARRLGMSTTTMNRWVRGRAPISKGRWVSVKAVLRLPADWQPKGES
jgi:DNA-binding transcriptional regulator YdaS (Cro superfamily)